MNSLGIYFGPKVISVVETKGRKLLNSALIPLSAISAGGLEEKVPEELKIVALLREELSKNRIEAKEATIALSGRDLIIRTFEMPILPAEELRSAVNFEARKYIPFKMEELVSDFQLHMDKISRRNLVLFAGIKKETMDKYLSIPGQLNIKTNALEYSAFSVLRLLKLIGAREKGVVAIINVDLVEKDEVNFSVLENGIPLLSRDISLTEGGRPEDLSVGGEVESEAALEELKQKMSMTLDHYHREFIKKELRISLDYYHRKFPTKNIDRTFFVTSEGYRSDLEAFTKEIGLLEIQFIDIGKYIGRSVPFSLSFIKGYACSLLKTIGTGVKIDLLAARTRVRPAKAAALPQELTGILTGGLKINHKILALSLLICIAPIMLGLYRRLPIEKALKGITGMRPQVSTVSAEAGYEELARISSEFKKKIDTIDNIIRKQPYLTEQLDAVPRLIPKGMWLTNLSFRKEGNRIEFTLKGNAYLEDSDKELQLVNEFLLNLKEDPVLNQHLKEMNIMSIDRGGNEKMAFTTFIITCRNYRD